MAGESGGSAGGSAGGGAAASLYSQAILMGVDMMLGTSKDAAYDAAYGPYYRKYQQMSNAVNQKVAAEANINAITQDRINTDVMIEIQQDKAEAQAKVMAAVSGVEGQSVQDVIYQTEFNSSVAQSNNQKNAEQNIENQLANIYTSQTTLDAAANTTMPTGPNVGLGVARAGIAAGLNIREAGGFDTMFGAGDSNAGDGDIGITYRSGTDTRPQI